jgi:hypothetical protein
VRATKDWRDRNRERVNAERRAAYREQHPRAVRDCVQCGQPFEGRPDALAAETTAGGSASSSSGGGCDRQRQRPSGTRWTPLPSLFMT